jgi:arylsulfatase A-like enzyme
LSVRVVGSSLSPEATTLAERLRQAGLATLGLSANPQVSPAFGYGQGFDVLSMGGNALDFQIVSVLKLAGAAFPGAAYELGVLGAELFYPPIAQLRQRALRLLDASPGPSLLYVQTMDVHGPYLPPRRLLPDDYRRENFLSYHQFLRLSGTPALRDPSLEPQLENLRQRYAAGARHTDEVLAAWIEELRARGRWDEALVWIVSDHGEAFGEHGMYRHGFEVWEVLVRVPLVVHVPGVKPRRVSARRSLIDLVPTVLEIMHVPPPPPKAETGDDFVSGQSLLVDAFLPDGKEAAQRDVYVDMPAGPYNDARRALIHGDMKLIVSGDRRFALYDLASDPNEERDLAEQADAKDGPVKEMKERYAAFKARLREVKVTGKRK